MLKKVLFGAGVLAASVAFASPAQASFNVIVSDGSTTITVTDSTGIVTGGGCTFRDGTSAAINLVNCAVGNFTVTGDIASNNVPGDGEGRLTSNITITSQGGGGTLTVETSADSYTQPGSLGSPMSLTSALAGTGAGTGSGTVNANFQSYANSPGSLDGTGNPTPLQSCVGLVGSVATQCAAAQTAFGTFVRTAANYSLTNLLTLTIGPNVGGAIQLQGTTTATAVPEPGSMLLLGTGLFGLARVARRRFNLGAR